MEGIYLGMAHKWYFGQEIVGNEDPLWLLSENLRDPTELLNAHCSHIAELCPNLLSL